jgi:hypothetical protein
LAFPVTEVAFVFQADEQTSVRKLKETVRRLSKYEDATFVSSESSKSKASETDAGDRPALAGVAQNPADAVPSTTFDKYLHTTGITKNHLRDKFWTIYQSFKDKVSDFLGIFKQRKLTLQLIRLCRQFRSLAESITCVRLTKK